MITKIRILLHEKNALKHHLAACISCGACAETCFYFVNSGDPQSTPSYKANNSLGQLFKKRGRLTENELDHIGELIWGKCVLCGQCSCPIGIDLPGIIAWARTVCREADIGKQYANDGTGL